MPDPFQFIQLAFCRLILVTTDFGLQMSKWRPTVSTDILSGCFNPLGIRPGKHFKLGHGRFLPHPLRFISVHMYVFVCLFVCLEAIYTFRRLKIGIEIFYVTCA
jgi:hypothetical protein